MGSLRDRRQPGARAEVAGQQRRDLGQARRLVGEDLLGAGPPSACEARQPGGDVQQRVADARVVPVDEQRPAVRAGRGCRSARRSAAGVVRRSRRPRTLPRAPAGGRRATPASRGRARGTAAGRRPRPATRPGRTGSRRRGHAGGWRGRVDGVEGREHRVDASGVPRRRPRRPERSSRTSAGAIAVVVPPEEPRQERLPVERRVARDARRGANRPCSRRPRSSRRRCSRPRVRRRSAGWTGRRARTRHARRPAPPRGHGAPVRCRRGRAASSEATDVPRRAVGSIDAAMTVMVTGASGRPRTGDRRGARASATRSGRRSGVPRRARRSAPSARRSPCSRSMSPTS